MADSRVASRYVKSLLGLASEQGVLEAVHNDMLLLAKTCRDSFELKAMLRSPIISHQKKNDILVKLFSGRVHKLTIAIIDIITRKNRESLLPAIAEEFHNAYNAHKGIQKASITTTFEIDQDIRTQVESMVKEISNRKTIELEEKIDEKLIGGFILNVGDKQIDASINNKLKELKLLFSQNPFVKEY
ncbi:MAG: ATP synthase F1 subunit delta [Cyclobacteriaceae bacterium]